MAAVASRISQSPRAEGVFHDEISTVQTSRREWPYAGCQPSLASMREKGAVPCQPGSFRLGNGSGGGARAKGLKAGVAGSVRRSRWSRICLITAGSSMLAITFTAPPQYCNGRPRFLRHQLCQSGRVKRPLKPAGASTMNMTQVGIDLAKLNFQVHGVDARGKPLLRKQLKRSQVGVLRSASTVPRWDGGLRRFAFLGTQADGVWTHGETDCAAVRQAVGEEH